MAATVSAGWPEGVEGWESPTWELPGVVPVERVLTRSNDVVISLQSIRVFSPGALVTFEIRLRDGLENDPEHTEDLHWLLTTRGRHPSPDGPTLSVRRLGDAAETGSRPSLNLEMRTGGSNGPIWHFTFWLPLSPVAGTTFVGAWPARGLLAGEATVSTEMLRAAHDAIQPL